MFIASPFVPIIPVPSPNRFGGRGSVPCSFCSPAWPSNLLCFPAAVPRSTGQPGETKAVGEGTKKPGGFCCRIGTSIPRDPSTFLGSVWGIIYYSLEG